MRQKRLLTENEIKTIIREEFAKDGIILTEEELNELFGLFGKSKLIKQINKLDPGGEELDKLGYDAARVKDLDKGALKQILGDLRDVKGVKAPKGIIQKVKDVYAGVKDIGIISGGAGTLLGGEETFDIEKRNELKGTAKKQIEGWLTKLEYEPLKTLYGALNKEGFPNNDRSNFKSNALYIQEEYDKVVKDFESEQIDATRANTIIAVLRALVIYYQDFAMSDKNFYMVTEEEERMGAAQGAVSKNFVAAYGNKLPLGLAIAGVGALGAGYAADSPFFQKFLQGFKDMDTIPTSSTITQSVQNSITELVPLGEIKEGSGGIMVLVRNLTPMKKFGLDAAGGSIGDLQKYPQVVKLIKASMMNQQAGPAALDQLIQQNANPMTSWVAGSASGTGKVGEKLFGINAGKFSENVTKVVSDTITKQVEGVKNVPADTLKNKFLNGLGNLLGPILKGLGLGALAAAAASWLMRQKGKGKLGGSRMSLLKKMVDGFLDVKPKEGEEGEKCPDGSDPPCEGEPPPPPPPEPDCPDDQVKNAEGECIDNPCLDEPGTTYNPETGKCDKEEEEPEPPEKPYQLKISDADSGMVGNMIRDFAEENNLELDEDALEELIGNLEDDWAAQQAVKGADRFDIDNEMEYAEIAEGENIGSYFQQGHKVSGDSAPRRGTGTAKHLKNVDDKLKDQTGGRQGSGRRRHKSKYGHIINVGSSKGRSKRHRSLNWHLTQALTKPQSKASDPLKGASLKQKKRLIRKIVKAMKADLKDQGATVSHQEQQQEAQELKESKTLDRWKVLSGLK